jgi:hypothetical protein
VDAGRKPLCLNCGGYGKSKSGENKERMAYRHSEKPLSNENTFL